MKVGDYIRDSEGEIAKIIKKHEIITEDNIYIDTTYYWKSLKDDCEGCFSENMYGIKSSPNIIDLIEVGDYVNYHRVVDIAINIEDKKLYLYVDTLEYNEVVYQSDIKSIVTKEQFSQMEYRRGE